MDENERRREEKSTFQPVSSHSMNSSLPNNCGHLAGISNPKHNKINLFVRVNFNIHKIKR